MENNLISEDNTTKTINDFLRSNVQINEESIKNIFTDLFKMTKKQLFLEEIFKQLKTKKIIFIRHAQSQYNSWKRNEWYNPFKKYENKVENYDPSITEQGKLQCK